MLPCRRDAHFQQNQAKTQISNFGTFLNTLGVPKRRSWAHLGRFGVDFFKQRQAAAMMSDFCIFSNSFWPPRGRLGNVLGDLGRLLGDLDGFCDFWNNPNDF